MGHNWFSWPSSNSLSWKSLGACEDYTTEVFLAESRKVNLSIGTLQSEIESETGVECNGFAQVRVEEEVENH